MTWNIRSQGGFKNAITDSSGEANANLFLPNANLTDVEPFVAMAR